MNQVVDPILQGKLSLFNTVDQYVKEKHEGKELRALDTNSSAQGFVVAFLTNGGGQVKVTREELNAWVESKTKKPVEETTTISSHS